MKGCKERGIKVIMDLVVNHTSTEHEWFQKSRMGGDDNPYKDYYFWRKGTGKDGKGYPNNWTSSFPGPAWTWDDERKEYYLHLFAVGQPDLNHDNPKVRQEVIDIYKYWLDMGVDGFREDVITYIAKADGLPSAKIKLPAATGMQYYTNLPKVHDYLAEFKRDVLDFYDCFTVGESPLTTADIALRYVTEGPDQVLDEMIAFSHMEADCFMIDMVQLPFNLVKMKRAFSDWQYKLAGRGWNALYIENHDHPRIISRYGNEAYRNESGKMLAAMYMLQRGTPFIYQGQEIGMLNLRLPDVNMYEDVMTHNAVRIASKIMPKKKVLEMVQRSCRDSARSPMQWSDGENAGFSTGKPWFYVNDNYTEINVASQEDDPDSLLNFYRKLLKFRKENPIAIYGDYQELLPNDKNLYVYLRSYEDKKLLVICSFTRDAVRFDAPESLKISKATLVLNNYEHNFVISEGFTTRPYEMRVYLFA